jgi:hypothetical protein
VGWIYLSNLYPLSYGETVKSIDISYGTLRVGEIADRVSRAYERQDRERMEWLNARIAEEKPRKKYVYARRNRNSPSVPCERCGRITGQCIAALHRRSA